MVLTSRSVASLSWDNMPVEVGAGEEVDWLREEESQDAWTVVEDWDCTGVAGVGVLACGFVVGVPFARAWASHASRVLWSTGQAAAGSSCEDIVVTLGIWDGLEGARNDDGDSGSGPKS
jgi:hypothetical protein